MVLEDKDSQSIEEKEEALADALAEYKALKVGPQRPAEASLELELLHKLPQLPQNGLFYIESLAQGIKLGRGWERNFETYPYDLLARVEAYQRCKYSQNMTRVVVTQPLIGIICVFYRKDNRTYIATPVTLKEGRKTIPGFVEQEIFSDYDETGGEIKLRTKEDYND